MFYFTDIENNNTIRCLAKENNLAYCPYCEFCNKCPIVNREQMKYSLKNRETISEEEEEE